VIECAGQSQVLVSWILEAGSLLGDRFSLGEGSPYLFHLEDRVVPEVGLKFLWWV